MREKSLWEKGVDRKGLKLRQLVLYIKTGWVYIFIFCFLGPALDILEVALPTTITTNLTAATANRQTERKTRKTHTTTSTKTVTAMNQTTMWMKKFYPKVSSFGEMEFARLRLRLKLRWDSTCSKQLSLGTSQSWKLSVSCATVEIMKTHYFFAMGTLKIQ